MAQNSSTMFFLLLTFFALSQTESLTNTIPIGFTLYANPIYRQTAIISPSGRFAFGFFPEKQSFYIGINMKVSNTQNPIAIWTAVDEYGGTKTFNKKAILTFSQKGFFLNPNNTILIEFNKLGLSTSAAMLENGNFVVLDENQSNCSSVYGLLNENSCIIWQSFDFPTDTMMNGQVLNSGRDLISRHSSIEKSFSKLSMQGDANLVIYTVTMNFNGLNGSTTQESKPIWASLTYRESYTKLVFGKGKRLYLNSSKGDPPYNLISQNNLNDDQSNMIYYAKLTPNNYFQIFQLNTMTNKITQVYEIPSLSDSDCRNQASCGLNSYCTISQNRAACRCLPGFNFTDFKNQTKGCQRNITQLKCSDTNFVSMDSLENFISFDEPYSIISDESMETCSRNCLIECDCEVAIFFNESCAKYKLPMTHASKNSNFTTGMKIPIAYFKNYTGGKSSNFERRGRMLEYIVVVALYAIINLGLFIVLLALGIGSYWIFYGRYKLLWGKWALAFQEEIAPRSFSYEYLFKITKSFTSKLGTGGQSVVYEGFIKMYGNVAVKMLSNEEEEGESDFLAEIRVIGRAHHANLIRLVGFCYETYSHQFVGSTQKKTKRLLVYEYMSRGSLANLIYQPDPPRWKIRVDILLDVARGIHYLHRECEIKIIHRDIKPENILIAANWRAKISDFGISKFSTGGLQAKSTTLTSAPGTPGYVAPECVLSKGQNVTEKADVFSFGIVVLETVFLQRNAGDNNLIDFAMKFCEDVEKGRRGELKLGEEKLEEERMVKLAMLCVNEDPEMRPDMEDVILSIREGVLPVPRFARFLNPQTIARDNITFFR